MTREGMAHKYGDNVDTDVILPARYMVLTDPQKLAQHCLEDLDRSFAQKVRPGDILVAGDNFGCGSSREHAPISIRACGVSCVIARSFARIFYRNAINIGLPIIECPAAVDGIRAGDRVLVDFDQGAIRNQSTGETFSATPFPRFIQSIIKANGLVNYTREKQLEAEKHD